MSKLSKTQRATIERVDAELHQRGLSRDDIHYVKPTGKQKNSKFCREHVDLVKFIIDARKIPKENTLIFYDSGTCYSKGSQSIWVDEGFEHSIEFPPCVHQLLSVNDNNAHGWAKEKWRDLNIDWKDDVVATLELLRLLKEYPPASVRKDWRRNFLLQQELDIETIKENIPSFQVTLSSGFYETCRLEYLREWKPERFAEVCKPIGTPKNLLENLDGSYYIDT